MILTCKFHKHKLQEVKAQHYAGPGCRDNNAVHSSTTQK